MSLIKYFEDGCLCIITGRIEKQPENAKDAESFYMLNCSCTRHPILDRDQCWDSNPVVRKKVLKKYKAQIKAHIASSKTPQAVLTPC